MILKDYLNYDRTNGTVLAAQDKIRATLKQLTEDFSNPEIKPADLYTTYFGSSNGLMKEISHLLATGYKLDYKVGNKISTFYISKLRDFSLASYLTNKYKKKDLVNQHNMYVRLRQYNRDEYWTICKLSVAMLINKYGEKSLYSEHILFQCICNLFYSFQVYALDAYLVNLDDVVLFYQHLINNTTVEELNDLAVQYGFRVLDNVPGEELRRPGGRPALEKPETREQIMELFGEDEDISTMHQKDIIARVQKWYPNLSVCTIRRQLSKLGFTQKKYERKDYREKEITVEHINDLHDHLDALDRTVNGAAADVLATIDGYTLKLMQALDDQADKSSIDANSIRLYLQSIEAKLNKLSGEEDVDN